MLYIIDYKITKNTNTDFFIIICIYKALAGHFVYNALQKNI
jgi:hypothetical protein